MSIQHLPVGTMVRDWRRRRRLSQLDLSLEAEISARHLSFVETGRAQPSRAMVLRLAEVLEIPHREQNALLVAAGFAPRFPERPLDSPDLAEARRAVEHILTAHEPLPALAIDRRWNLVAANRAVEPFMDGVDPELRESPINVMRFSLHPGGLARRICNLDQWRDHMIRRLERDIELTGMPELVDLLDEIRSYSGPGRHDPSRWEAAAISSDVAMPIELGAGDEVWRFWSTTTVFGTPIDITLSELAIEAFFPADERTARGMGLRSDP